MAEQNISVELSYQNVGDSDGLLEADREVLKNFDEVINSFRSQMVEEMKKKNKKPKIVESIVTGEM